MDYAREIKLIRFVEANIGLPFIWGQRDCNVVALEAMDAVHGTDLASKIRGKYHSEAEAIEYRKQSPWGTFINLLKEAGFIEIKQNFEQTGDLLVADDPKWEMVHVNLGIRAISSFPEYGVQCFPSSLVRESHPYTVWRMPCLP